MAKSKAKNDGRTLEITKSDGTTEKMQMARVVMQPQVRNGNIVGVFGYGDAFPE
ncbi:MAG: hypothetical protein HQ482_04480 [Sphingomonadales bacterium]|nr:hypothetical protein [Sphingomonadales bacterium]